MARDFLLWQEFLLNLAAQEREEYYLDQYGKVGGWDPWDVGHGTTMAGGSGVFFGCFKGWILLPCTDDCPSDWQCGLGIAVVQKYS